VEFHLHEVSGEVKLRDTKRRLVVSECGKAGMKRILMGSWAWFHNSVRALNVMEPYPYKWVKWQILSYVYLVTIKSKKSKRQQLGGRPAWGAESKNAYHSLGLDLVGAPWL
jgi:hypothetical protein